METKLTFKKGWIRFWVFIAGLFQDKAEGTSMKRTIVFGAFIELCVIINTSVNMGKDVDMNLVTALLIVILGGLGLTIPEWFSKYPVAKMNGNGNKPTV